MPGRFTPDGSSGGAAVVVWGPSFGVDGDLVEQESAAMPSVKLTGGVGHAAAATFPTVKLAGGVTHAAAPAMPTVSLAGGVTHRVDVTTVRFTTSAILAPKDSWCDVIAACPVDVNRDATDLQLDGVVATRKDIIVGWDLAGFPTGATVTSATVTLGLKTAPTVGGTLTTCLIATGDEGWSETTVKCSTIPGVESIQATASVTTTAGPRDISVTMNAAQLTRIGARMGVGSFSLRIIGDAAMTNCVFESADQGTDNNLGPRLTFAFTTPN